MHSLCTGQFQNCPCPPPRANPRAFDFCEKFWSNSPLCCQFRRSNAPPVRTSKRVKSPTLPNKFCKIFSHYEFPVQLVFAPHYFMIELHKTTTTEKPTWNRKRNDGSPAESKNCEILLPPTADRRFDTKVKCSTGRASFWVKFPTVRSLTRVKCPRIARGGMGGFGIDWYIMSAKQKSVHSSGLSTKS